jgi:hypothetical protein
MQRTGIVLALTVLTAAAAVDATQVLYRTPQELGKESVLVVQGRVSGVESYWNDTHTKILTEARIAVDASFKGDGGRSLRVVQMGGVVGNVRMTVHGAIQWHAGQEVVLFLEPSLSGAYTVSGFTQGKFDVERDPDTGLAYVRRPAQEGVQMVGRPDDGPAVSTLKRVPVQRFIDDALGRRGGDR